MAFKLKVYTSKNFLLKLEEFKIRTIEEFGSDINIESYLFFKTIIYQKASQIITDISEEEICRLKEISNDPIIEKKNEDLIRLFKSLRHNSIKSDNCLIQKLKNKEIIEYVDLPHYLFLGGVSSEICKDIEEHYGIACYSVNRLIVDERIRMVCLDKLPNTKNALYNKISETSFNNIQINDPFFFKNAFEDENRNEIIVNLLKRKNLYKAKLKVDITTTLKQSGRTEKEFEEWGRKFQTELASKQNNTSFSLALGKGDDGSDHDRYVFTNTHINILGTSFLQNKKTHFTSFPIGIYYPKFEKELEI